MRALATVLLLIAALTSHGQGTWRVDSLLTTWPVHRAVEKDRTRTTPGVIRAVDAHGIDANISKAAPGLPAFSDTAVQRYVELYGEPKREDLRALLGAAQAYFPMIEGELVRQGLPKELKYLPMALSAMNTQGGSRSGQAGLWMLSYPVAMRYGLRVNAEVDERRDPRLSTIAAVSYLKDLHAQYATDAQAIMAFACGPANLERALGRTGGSARPAELYPHFTAESRDVLPLLMAFTYLATNADRLGIAPLEVDPLEAADTVHHTNDLRLTAIAASLRIEPARLRALNPVLSKGILPAHHALLLPEGEGPHFAQLADSIQRQQLRATEELVLASAAPSIPRADDGREAIHYRVRQGDYLGRIAQRFGVKVSQLKSWNKLRTDRITAGDELIIYLPPSQRARYERLHQKDTDEAEPVNHAPAAQPLAKPAGVPGYTWYTVQRGDSLYGIARKYPGVDADTLMQVNRITANIHPGQKLKIPLNR